MDKKLRYQPYEQPAGGWGSLKSLARHSLRQGAVGTAKDLMTYHNKTGGYMCVSCAWAKPAEPHLGEFCENGAKATFWELTSKRTAPSFFAEHTVTELLAWTDHDLENQGRLTHPMRYDAKTDHYVEVSWREAFADIGQQLRGFEPKSVVFYTSGRASLETSYMYQLFARMYGCNNLPDSSNMCHETTSVALPESIGVSVGTVILDDFEQTTCILSFGQNVGTNSPRMLHQLQEVRERDVPIIVFNPLREKGWEEFINPQRPGQMITNTPTQIATEYYQVRTGGDIAAMMGMCKALIEWDDESGAAGRPRTLDAAFIREHTQGFERFAQVARAYTWPQLEEASGLSRAAIETAARTYSNAKAVIAIYGMGLTQHRGGSDSVQMLVNLLLLRGNIGKPGAGICPVRGHSNVQGQRTVGISEKTKLVPMDRLADLYGFEPPREDGLTTVDVCKGVIDGSVKAFVGMGGNFVRAIPERGIMEPAWRKLNLAVHVATKLNRTHLVTAKATYLLPCLGRIEHDSQASGLQVVTMEDSTSCIHASRGQAIPASEHLLSEPRIVAELAKAALEPNPHVPWDDWVGDYGLVRNAIEATYPDDFRDYNARMDTPGGFHRYSAARERKWNTDTGKANFLIPSSLSASFDDGRDVNILRLMTLRSNDQFNTTVYGYRDRFRGIYGSRMVLMMNSQDMSRLGIANEAMVSITTVTDDGVHRTMDGFKAIEYNVPPGCCAGYYPECNALIPLWQHDQKSKTPAAKSIPVRVAAMA